MVDLSKDTLLKLLPMSNSEGRKIVEAMLLDDEEVIGAFTTIRDKVIVTDRRLMIVNVQGAIGKKTDYTSLPFNKVQAFSVETSGVFDIDCEIDLWFVYLGRVRLEIAGKFDIRAFNKVLSSHIL